MEQVMTMPTAEAESRLRGVAKGNLDDFDFLHGDVPALDAETIELIQIAALAAVDGCPVSWLARLEAADAIDLDLEKVLGTLIAIAPIVGAPRVVSAGAKIVHAMGLQEESA
jgi:alkylhydroperoxidase/carboxymuconolactone decarboxylase family protein YurZ